MASSSFVQSPTQAAADAGPPQPSVLTAPVTSQRLQSTVVLRGTFSEGKKVSVTPTSVAATAENPAGASPVLTKIMVKPGDEVRAGSPLVEYSGRPVFALAGSLPVYRDLLPGQTGADVAQLRTALESMGHGTGPDEPGRFGPGTKRALGKLYQAMGYPVPVTGAATTAAVKAARQEAEQARAALKEAQAAPPATVKKPVANAGSSPGSKVEPSAGAVPTTDLAALRRQVTQTQEALDRADSADGPMLPASEYVYLPALPARVATLPLEVGDAVKGPVITLARGEIELTGMLDPARASLVKTGMVVQVLSESQGRSATATVASVGALVAPGDAGTNDAGTAKGTEPTGAPAPAVNGGAAYIPLTIKPDTAWDGSWTGQDVRITITAAMTDDAVLAVPQAAIFAGADARTHLTKVAPDGSQHLVNVTVGPSADGLVQVTATDGGSLAAGDLMVIGQ